MYFVCGWSKSSGRTDSENPTFCYSADEGVDVGMDNETNVSMTTKKGIINLAEKLKR